MSRKGIIQMKDKLEFIALLSRELPDHSIGAVVELGQTLMRQGHKHAGLACALCNGVIDQDEFERRTERIRQKLAKLLDVLGIRVRYGGDPRGFTVKLRLKSGRYNTWGGAEDGWGVPGS